VRRTGIREAEKNDATGELEEPDWRVIAEATWLLERAR
jgi:hypothetical protein